MSEPHSTNVLPCGGDNNIHNGCQSIFPNMSPPANAGDPMLCQLCKKILLADSEITKKQIEVRLCPFSLELLLTLYFRHTSSVLNAECVENA